MSEKPFCAGLAADAKDTPADTPQRQAAAHTPGPWHWEPTAFLNDENEFDSLCDAGDECVMCGVWVSNGTTHIAIDRANAHLIAAAPDLLAALKAMVASYDGLRDLLTCDVVKGKIAAAEAAIRKAEGKQ